VGKIHPALGGTLANQQRSNQEARNHEENINADEATRKGGRPQMKDQYGNHRERT